MKVIVLCTQLEGGGAQRAAFRLSGELIRRGISCENWFLYKKRDNYSDLGKTVIFLDRPLNGAFDYLKICYSYYRRLRKERPDAVVAFTHYSNILGLLIAMLAGIKIRIASHRNPSWGDMSKFFISIDTLFAKYKIYTAITAVSKSTKNSFSHYPLKEFQSIKVINNGLTFPDLTINKAQAREILNLPQNITIIGTIGRLSKQKNHQLLLKAVAALENIHLAIAGEGELRQEMEEQITRLRIQKKVTLLGELKYDQIPVFLNSLDIYVMPSLFEGLSNALVEAMAAGVPIISSDVDSQRDVIISDDNVEHGILLPAEEVDPWIENLHRLRSAPALLEEYSKLSKNRASDYTVSKMADGFWEVITMHNSKING